VDADQVGPRAVCFVTVKAESLHHA
jgi:hypothetical protein